METIIKLDVNDVAEAVWNMNSDEQAELLSRLYELSEGSHRLVLQGLSVRESCEKKNDDSLEAFQYLFASAFKYLTHH